MVQFYNIQSTKQNKNKVVTYNNLMVIQTRAKESKFIECNLSKRDSENLSIIVVG